MMASASASQIVEKLNLKPHQEGGFYSETLRDTSVTLSKSHLPSTYKVDRPISTCIYFLLPSGSVSVLHRIPCAETWHFYMGEPLTVLEMNDQDGSIKLTCLGPNPIDSDQHLQYTVPPNVWFGAYPTQDINVSSENGAVKTAPRDAENHFSLVGCTCAPAFQFEDFELARRSELISLFPKYESLINLLTFAE
ncbi:Ubiquitin-conjugating enzyme suppressor like [Actinidia chinensis var. chinensis]|uniref:Ubiquitin-conjugating enzyme suppressor like n=1 Tax=Actinidia chinensis var. chinensis TaxID=1590841 RepID=A0A2R6Q583_ACTCC|nr:Ubiquitin-conjugating enzyme suppressor like [Actinidia chinensis var. chinensis]